MCLRTSDLCGQLVQTGKLRPVLGKLNLQEGSLLVLKKVPVHQKGPVGELFHPSLKERIAWGPALSSRLHFTGHTLTNEKFGSSNHSSSFAQSRNYLSSTSCLVATSPCYLTCGATTPATYSNKSPASTYWFMLGKTFFRCYSRARKCLKPRPTRISRGCEIFLKGSHAALFKFNKPV